MKALEPLEKSLNDLFVKQAPALPKSIKDLLVQYAPWLVLIGALASAWSAWSIYRWVTSPIASWARDINNAFGVDTGVRDWSLMLWLSVGLLALTAVLYFLAFSPLQAKRKAGWDLVFYALIVNVIYGVISAFNGYGGAGSFIGVLIGSAIGGWILFQIRGAYTAGGEKPAAKPAVDKPKASD